ncbi:MAG TPA: FG-GAP-like repeat-containing protein, partial [Isosphaeraceae bacterium]|nr:FG-GAP-like repeat-containing protein [Isosphaeraceae bacterium]
MLLSVAAQNAVPIALDSGLGVATSMVSADFTNDGHADLATSTGDSTISVWPDQIDPSTGNWSLGGSQTLSVSGGTISQLVTGDFNQDGSWDLAALVKPASPTDAFQVAVFLSQGGVLPSSPTSAINVGSAGDTVTSIVVGMFDAGDVPDLAVSNSTAKTIDVLVGDGSGGFSAPTPIVDQATTNPISLTDAPMRLSAANLDGVGGDDLVVTLAGTPNQSVMALLNHDPSTLTFMFDEAANTKALSGAAKGLQAISAHGAGYLAVTDDSGLSVYPVNGDGSLGSVLAFGGIGTSAIAAGDLDRDGLAELAVLDSTNSKVDLYHWDSYSGFVLQASPSVASGQTPDLLALGDLTGDGYPDVVTTGASSMNEEYVSVVPFLPPVVLSPPSTSLPDLALGGQKPILLRGTDFGFASPMLVEVVGDKVVVYANGNLSTPNVLNLANGLNINAAYLADLDGNGTADLVLTSATNQLVVVLQDTLGNFGAPVVTDLPDGTVATAVAVGHFNGSTDELDIAVGDASSTGQILIYQVTSAGAVVTPSVATFGPLGSIPDFLAKGTSNGSGDDLIAASRVGAVTTYRGDGDGFSTVGSDLAASSVGGLLVNQLAGTATYYITITDPNAGQVVIIPVNSDGTYDVGNVSHVFTGGKPEAITSADLDGDGHLDLIVADPTNGDVRVLMHVAGKALSDVNGGFDDPVVLSVPQAGSPYGLAALDVNGDGFLDIVAANQSDGQLGDLLQTPPRVAVAQTPVSVKEGDVGTTTAYLPIVLNDAIRTSKVSVNYSTADPALPPNSLLIATAGTDYVAVNNATYTFDASTGVTWYRLPFTINNDVVPEGIPTDTPPYEEFVVNLSLVTPAFARPSSQMTGTVKILDNDNFIVTNNSNDAATEGSLPYVLAKAKLYYIGTGLTPYITFDIPSGDPNIIQPLNDLVIDFPVIIDATTQPLYVPGTVITLDGQDTVNYGFDVTDTGVEIRGFVITHFVQAGIFLDTVGGDRIQANQIVDNQGYGILINSPDNLVGGYYQGYDPQGVPQPNSMDGGNVIEINQVGVFLTGAGATRNSIGGALSDPLRIGTTGGNTISQNRRQGVLITSNASANLVQGNLVDSNGQTGTGYFGVEIDDSYDNS